MGGEAAWLRAVICWRLAPRVPNWEVRWLRKKEGAECKRCFLHALGNSMYTFVCLDHGLTGVLSTNIVRTKGDRICPTRAHASCGGIPRHGTSRTVVDGVC